MNEAPTPNLIEGNITETVDVKTAVGIVTPEDQIDTKNTPQPEQFRRGISSTLADTLRKCHEGVKNMSLKKNILIKSVGGIIVAAAIQGVNLEKTMKEMHRNKVTEEEVENNADGITSKHKEFKHEDPETTHIINALCGKEPFTEKEKLNIAIGITVKSCRASKTPVPEGIQNWNLQEIRNLYIQTANNPRYCLDEFDTILSGTVYLEGLYSIIWEQEKRSGSPYVRWSVTENSSNIGDELNGAFYIPQTHTICIKPESLASSNMTKQYVAEVSHALQYKDRPIRSLIDNICDNFTVSLIASQTGTNKRDVYHQILYDDPRTAEYEAHKIIEPTLQAEVDKAKQTSYDSTTSYYPSEDDTVHLNFTEDSDDSGIKK